LPAGVAVNGNGYDTSDQFQSENSGLNFHHDFPSNVPNGFTFIHTLHNRIYRREGNDWAVLLEGNTTFLGNNNFWSFTGNSGTNPNNNFLGTTDNQPLVIRTNNTERVRIDTNGNVGIGTNSPTAQFHTTGTVRLQNYASGANGALLRTDSSGNLSLINFPGSTNEVLLGNATFAALPSLAWTLSGNSGTNSNNNFLGTTDNVGLTIRTNNTARMFITPTGDVGIGTTTPVSRLNVHNGHLAITNSDNTARELRLYEPSGAGTNFTAFRAQAQASDITYTLPASLTATSTIATGLLQTDANGNLSWLNPSALNTGSSGASWSLTGNSGTNPNNNFLGTTDNQPLVFRTNNTEQVRLDTNGNFGIGTVSPAARLHVNGTIRFQGLPTTTSGNYLVVDNTGNVSVASPTQFGDQDWLVAQNDPNGGVGTIPNSIGRWIYTNGRVGIGTSNPTESLHVHDGHLILTNSDNTARQLRLYEPSGAGSNFTAFRAQAQTSDITYTLPASLTATSTIATGLLQTDANGNLSWLNPSALSTGSSSASWSLTGNSGTNPNNNFLGTTDNQPLVIRTNNTERVRIDTNGNVGIGTTAPSQRLDVAGNVRFSGALMPGGNAGASGQVLVSQGAGTPAWQTLTASTVNAWSLSGNVLPAGSEFLGSINAQPLIIRTNNTERMRVTQTGYVGIGTSTPGASLDVRGYMHLSTVGNLATGIGFVRDGNLRAVFQLQASNELAIVATSIRADIGDTFVIMARVGIGTTAPNRRLHVEDNSNSYSGITIRNTNAGFSARAAVVVDNGTVYASFGLRGTGSSPANMAFMEIPGAGLSITGGNVGIGTTTPSQRLHVVGNFMLVNNGASIAYKDGTLTWSNASDARLKTNIQPITNALEKITKLRGVSFDWINQDLHKGDAKSGFLAQEMEQVFPDCVQEVEVDSNSPDAKLVGDGKIKTVGLTTGFFASMVEAIKEQQQIIEGLQKTVAQQQQLIDLQNQKIAQLEQKLEELANKLGS
jgi:hypothetical protein